MIEATNFSFFFIFAQVTGHEEVYVISNKKYHLNISLSIYKQQKPLVSQRVQRTFLFQEAAFLFSPRNQVVVCTELKFSNHKTSCRCIRASNLEWVQVQEVEDYPWLKRTKKRKRCMTVDDSCCTCFCSITNHHGVMFASELVRTFCP